VATRRQHRGEVDLQESDYAGYDTRGDDDRSPSQLLIACQQDEHRRIAGREQNIGTDMIVEREHLLPLAPEGMDLAQTSFPTVNSLGCTRVLTNAYSVPLKAGTQVQAKADASTVELWHDGRCIARHERCYSRQQQILDLEHYLDVLYRKPGALAGSRPLEQQRRAGLWPESFDDIWQALMRRHGKQRGTKQMIGLLQLGKQYGRERLRTASETAAATGCSDTSGGRASAARGNAAARGLRADRHRVAGRVSETVAGDE
jgi:hypothetical protein